MYKNKLDRYTVHRQSTNRKTFPAKICSNICKLDSPSPSSTENALSNEARMTSLRGHIGRQVVSENDVQLRAVLALQTSIVKRSTFSGV